MAVEHLNDGKPDDLEGDVLEKRHSWQRIPLLVSSQAFPGFCFFKFLLFIQWLISAKLLGTGATVQCEPDESVVQRWVFSV